MSRLSEIASTKAAIRIVLLEQLVFFDIDAGRITRFMA